MVVISKEVFYENIKHVDCGEWIHFWHKDCLRASVSPFFIANMIKGSGSFFLPIHLLRLFLDYKRKKKNIVQRFLLSELQSIVYGYALGSSFFSTICLLKKLCGGKVYYYNVLCIPAFLSGPSLFILSPEHQTLATILFFNSFIETELKKLSLSPKKEILLFIGMSGILMQLFENRTEKIDFSYLWFFTPPLQNKDTKEEQNKCHHEESCQSYLYNGLVNYFLIGYGINITKGFLSKFNLLPKNPLKLVDILFNKSNSDFGLFVAAYVGIYRFVSCYLVKSTNIKKQWHGLISGALAGTAYTICPTMQISVLALTTTLQMIYSIISKKLNITDHSYQRLLVFSLTHAYNIHNKFFYPDTSSSYYFKMIDACTNNITAQIYRNLLATYFPNETVLTKI